jgi:hypothetical protein
LTSLAANSAVSVPSNVVAGRKVVVAPQFKINDLVKVINEDRSKTYGFRGYVSDIDEEFGMIAVYIPVLGFSPWYWTSELCHVNNQRSWRHE